MLTLNSLRNLATHCDASGCRAMLERIALMALTGYRTLISPLKPPTCRFHPTCSGYARDAIRRYGLGRGCWLTAKRLARCHPWHPGGYDPVE